MAKELTAEFLAREEAFLSVDAWESCLLPIPKSAEFQLDEDADYCLSEALRVGICSVFDSFDSVADDDDLIAGEIPYFGRRYRILLRMKCEIQNSGRLSRFDPRLESIIAWFSEQFGSEL